MNLKECIKELERIDQVCDDAMYSTDTANEILVVSKSLKIISRDIYQCCF